MSRILDFIENLRDSDYSDIHIREGERISIRILGDIIRTDTVTEIKDITDFIKEIGLEFKDGFSSYCDEEKSDSSYERDFSFYYSGFRFRGNMFFNMGKTGISLRKISTEIKSFTELSIPVKVENLCGFSSGIVFITGPTGSGKTTTLAAIVQYINENCRKHIITIEDPIEFVFKNKNSIITQREVGKDTASFSDAIKSSLRQDPDVIIIGEVRDAETMRNAIRAAETGHLCFCTLHTVGSVSTVERIAGMFSGDEKERIKFELSTVLKAILSQQLLKVENRRVPVVEFLLTDKSVLNMIKEGKTGQIPNYIHTNSSKGLISMDTELLKVYSEGMISRDVLMNKCIDREYIGKSVSKRFLL